MRGALASADAAGPRTGAGRVLVDPSTGEAFHHVQFTPLGDLERILRTAAEAQVSWARSTIDRRAAVLRAMADQLEARGVELIEAISRPLGLPRHLVMPLQVSPALSTLRGLADTVEQYAFVTTLHNSVIRREPAGVVAAITPWNYPLLQAVNKVAAAIGAGCSIVLKPSELTPLDALVLADAARAAGLPAGVFQVVLGDGPGIGQALVSHPLVDVVSFTGSTEVGRTVAVQAAATFTRVSLELGGKSASVVLPDADVAAAVRHCVGSVVGNSGQTCTALSRLIVPRERADEVQEYAGRLMAAKRVGPSDDAQADLGPVINASQQRRVQDLVAAGIAEGARLVVGGVEPPSGLPSGYYVQPTVFGDVQPQMRIAQEEVFGPVLAIMAYDDVDHAVAIANDTRYGLSGAVWSADPLQAADVAARIATGQVSVNGGPFNPVAPFGGVKDSGLGREKGEHGLDEFVELKAVQMPSSEDARAYCERGPR